MDELQFLNKPNDNFLKVSGLKRYFDVSKPWLNRVLGQEPKKILKAVDDISFVIRRGKTFSLVGESGCGKSTVGNLLVGLYGVTDGIIEFNGEIIPYSPKNKRKKSLRQRMAMIFQSPYSSLNHRWRVKSIIAEPIKAFNLRNGHAAVEKRIDELMLQVGLAVKDKYKYPHEFSGGQQQRISIARALAGEPEFIVCDEPTSALDVSVQAQILNLMKNLQEEIQLTYLFISHDLSVVYHISDYVAVMYLGQIVESNDVRELYSNPKHPYTKMLLDNIPKLGGNQKSQSTALGEVPSPINRPNGCSFHPRCPLAFELCTKQAPSLTSIDGSGFVACHACSNSASGD